MAAAACCKSASLRSPNAPNPATRTRTALTQRSPVSAQAMGSVVKSSGGHGIMLCCGSRPGNVPTGSGRYGPRGADCGAGPRRPGKLAASNVDRLPEAPLNATQGDDAWGSSGSRTSGPPASAPMLSSASTGGAPSLPLAVETSYAARPYRATPPPCSGAIADGASVSLSSRASSDNSPSASSCCRDTGTHAVEEAKFAEISSDVERSAGSGAHSTVNVAASGAQGCVSMSSGNPVAALAAFGCQLRPTSCRSATGSMPANRTVIVHAAATVATPAAFSGMYATPAADPAPAMAIYCGIGSATKIVCVCGDCTASVNSVVTRYNPGWVKVTGRYGWSLSQPTIASGAATSTCSMCEIVATCARLIPPYVCSGADGSTR